MAEQYTSQARNPSKRDKLAAIQRVIQNNLDAGKTMTEILESEIITLAQYDFLCDNGIDLDKLILSPENYQNMKALMAKGVGRPLFPNGYDKKYPPKKREFYEKLAAFIKAEGGIIEPREKCNYRDIDFTWQDETWRIVFSKPTKK